MLAIEPGTRVLLAYLANEDRVKSSVRRGGVIKAATVSKITIDDSSQTNFPAINDSPTISCILSDGSVETNI